MTERYYRPPPPHRRKTPSFSSSLLDSILRSIDETNDKALHDDNLHQQVHDHDYDPMVFAPEPKWSKNHQILIDQWAETRNKNNRNSYVPPKSSSKFSLDSSSTELSETETPSTYRSLPNSFTVSSKTAEDIFFDNTQKESSTNKLEGKFKLISRTRLLKIYSDLKKVKQPISPGKRISTFIYSLFASSKKAKIEESMQNFKSLKKSRSIKQDKTMTCTSFSRSCMSKKQHSSSVKRSVRFYPVNDTVVIDRKSINEHDSNSTPIPKNYKNFTVDIEDDHEDDLFELEIVGGVGIGAYEQELPVFETTDLRKIRI